MSRVLGLFSASVLAACQPDLAVGSWTCASSTGPAGPVDAGVLYPSTAPIEVPWSTGFEDAYCGYNDALGWCYAHQNATFTTVFSPVHAGRRALAFSIDVPDAGGGTDTRCAREGSFPHDAYYGAWFYLPSLPASVSNWNLVHFQGGSGDRTWKNLWDVTLAKKPNGNYGLSVVDGNANSLGPNDPPDVPVGSWFRVVFRLVRSAGTNGEVTLYQDDQPLLDAPGIVTDPYPYDQWYVGNQVNTTTAPDLTVYVDDVSVSATP